MEKDRQEQVVSLLDEKELIQVTQDLVKIPSINPPGNERPAVAYVMNYFQRAGIDYQEVPVTATRSNVVARLKGKSSDNALVFSGHMDVVPVSPEEETRWNSHPFGGKIENGYLYGRGSSDMKGGLAAAMVAMTTLAKHGVVPSQDVILAATIDEEDLMRGSKALHHSLLLKGAQRLVICEPTGLELCRISKGRTWARIIVHGKTAHGSQSHVGVNAIEMAMFLLQKIKGEDFTSKAHSLFGKSFWRALNIQAGVEPMVLPDRCTMVVDARLVPGHHPEEVWNRLQQIIDDLKAEQKEFQADFQVIEAREPWETDSSTEIVNQVKYALKKIQVPCVESIFAGTTDGTVLRRNGLDTVILGPGDLSLVHRENERLALAELVKAGQLYLTLMLLP